MIDKELLKGSVKTIVLKILSRDSMHGYELSQRMKELTAGKVEVTEGTLYPMLHSLEADGSIRSQWEIVPGKRKKKVYTITTKGKKLLKEKTKNWNEFVSTMDLVLSTKYSAGRLL